MKKAMQAFIKQVVTTGQTQYQILDLTNLKGKTAIFVVDMVNGFCKQGPLASNTVAKIIPAIKTLLVQAMSKKNPCFCSQW